MDPNFDCLSNGPQVPHAQGGHRPDGEYPANRLSVPEEVFPENPPRFPRPTTGMTDEQMLRNCALINIALRCELCGEYGHRADTCARRPTASAPTSYLNGLAIQASAEVDRSIRHAQGICESALVESGYSLRQIHLFQWQSRQAHLLAAQQGGMQTPGLHGFHLRYLNAGGMPNLPPIHQVAQRNSTPASHNALNQYMANRRASMQSRQEAENWRAAPAPKINLIVVPPQASPADSIPQQPGQMSAGRPIINSASALSEFDVVSLLIPVAINIP